MDNTNSIPTKKKKSAFKGLIGILSGKSKKKEASQSQSSKEDETNENEISYNYSTNSLEFNEDEKLIIQYETLSITDELSQGQYSSLCHAELRNIDVAVVKAKDENPLTIQNMEYQMKVLMDTKPHKNVWRCIGVATDPAGPSCVVMEPVYGFLDDKIHGTLSNLDGKTIVNFAKQIANGMRHLHNQGIIHGDLGCRSITAEKIEEEYLLKIGGFDLSCMETDFIKIHELKRTESWSFRWTAPEVLLHNALSKSADVWSFGVLLWEMCERRRPYEGMTQSEVIEGVCHHDLRLPDPYHAVVPEELIYLIRECWNQPQQRPTFDDICVLLDSLYKG